MSQLKIPEHLAIIMDGNGRWAKQRGLPRVMGHKAGIESVREVVRVSSQLGVKWLTLFTFSSENWRRPQEEVAFLMKMLQELLDREVEELNRNQVRIMGMGRLDMLPPEVQSQLKRAQQRTENNPGMRLVLALSYGGKAEMVDMAREVAKRVAGGQLRPEDVDEELLQECAYIPEMPPVDLLIRTSMELRLSNFMLWQTAYSELYFTETLWPDFRKKSLLKAIEDYSKRERRFGGL